MMTTTARVFSTLACNALFCAAQAQSVEEPVRAYLDCAKTAIPVIDDRVSDAATVAIGLHAQCRPAFLDAGLNVDRQNHMAELLRPNLVQLVLLSRSASARAQAPTKSSKGKPNL